MNPLQSLSLAGSYARPSKLYRYSQRHWLERSLTQGEFRLCPPASTAYAMAGSDQIMPFGPKPAAVPTGFLTLSMASAWDDFLFDAFGGADCCLVIHDVEAFGERVHRAAQRVLPSWAGIDAAISYGKPSPLGAVFSKARQLAAEKEWLFAWRPTQRTLSGNPVVIQLGSIEGIAELRERSKDPAP